MAIISMAKKLQKNFKYKYNLFFKKVLRNIQFFYFLKTMTVEQRRAFILMSRIVHPTHDCYVVRDT